MPGVTWRGAVVLRTLRVCGQLALWYENTSWSVGRSSVAHLRTLYLMGNKPISALVKPEHVVQCADLVT